MTTQVAVPERGHRDLTLAEWQTLRGEPHFWQLVGKGFLSVVEPERARVRLEGSSYVGRVRIGNAILTLEEKVPGALVALISYATGGAFKHETIPTTGTELGPLYVHIVRQFSNELRRYLSSGREAVYRRVEERGSLIGGSLDVTKTVQLWARGLQHQVVFRRNVLSSATLKNRVLLAALQEIERVSRVMDVPAKDLSVVRGLALLLSDCRDAELLFGSRQKFVRYVDELTSTSSLSPEDRSLLELAGVVLAHVSFEPAAPIEWNVPTTWFLNLEGLFERAVRRVLRSVVQHKGLLVTGPGDDPPLIFDAAETYSANPDLVTYRAVTPVSVGDVKYKQWTEEAAASDIYQLLVHAAAYDVHSAYLVYPHDSFETRKVGRSVTDCDVWLFAVNVKDLESGCAQITELLFPGSPPKAKESLKVAT